MTFGDFLQSKMKEKNLDRSTLADLVGCSRRTVYNWEHNIRMPKTFDIWDAIAQAIDVPTEKLIHEAAEEKRAEP